MHWLTLIFLGLALAYVSIMALYAYGWLRTEVFTLPEGFAPRTKVTVVVPARNEQQHIRECLLSILKNDYPPALWELLVLDDHSEDRTAEIVEETFSKAIVEPTGKIAPQLRLIPLAEAFKNEPETLAFKKKGIELAIREATGDLIVTTDADCVVQPDWLRHLVAVHELEHKEMIAAPVLFHREKGIFQKFQALDFLGMMGITAAGIRLGFQRMANGANFAYTKALFQEVGGFRGIDDLASGDDMLLMQKVAQKRPETLFFLKNPRAATATLPAQSLSDFMRQRLRWASKSGRYPEPAVQGILLAVFLFCWAILIDGVLACLWPSLFMGLFLKMILLKMIGDFIFLRLVSRFFQRGNLMRWFLPSFFLHTLYIAGIGLFSQVRKEYEWKGRKVR